VFRVRATRGRVVAAAIAALVLVASVIVVVEVRPHGATCHVTSKDVPQCGAWWGAALHSTDSGLPAAVRSNESATGRGLDIVHTYHRWSDVFPTASELELAQSGHQLMLNWEPVDKSGHAMSWAAIARGANDAEIDAEARRLAAVHAPVYVSFSHEPELNWGSHGSAADFHAAFRHVVERSRAEGATNVLWVWDLMGLPGSVWSARYQQMWPGDAYVDWVAWDPYNWGDCRSRAWKSFAQTVQPFYGWLESNGFGQKPFMLAEYGTVEDPQRLSAKADWLTGVSGALKSLPNLKALLYFDLPAPPANCNWEVSTSTLATAGYDALAKAAPFAASAGRKVKTG
jgi:hypothetical protein